MEDAVREGVRKYNTIHLPVLRSDNESVHRWMMQNFITHQYRPSTRDVHELYPSQLWGKESHPYQTPPSENTTRPYSPPSFFLPLQNKGIFDEGREDLRWDEMWSNDQHNKIQDMSKTKSSFGSAKKRGLSYHVPEKREPERLRAGKVNSTELNPWERRKIYAFQACRGLSVIGKTFENVAHLTSIPIAALC